jgi:hypothetical protein
MATRAGDGLRALLNSPDDLDEAHHTCLNGLLASQQVSLAQLREAGERLVTGPVVVLENEAGRA